MDMPPRQRLSADDWVTAGLEALAEGGVDAVAVEPLAARLGATKGSFYWHFKDRESLVQATLDHWEKAETDAVITELDHIDDPAARLLALFDLVLTHPGGEDPVISLFRDARHPAVAAALERVTQRRISYVTALLLECGVERAEAQRRAVVAYAAYVGWWQLRTVVPAATPRGSRARPYAVVLQELLGDLRAPAGSGRARKR
jgi:AcrR family transcriptional regulator